MDETIRFWLGSAIFLITYLAIAFERRLGINKTATALLGSSLMLIFILSGTHGGTQVEKPVDLASTVESAVGTEPSAALEVLDMDQEGEGALVLDSYSRHVDFNVIFLLAGMMVIVNVLQKTGMFQYMAIWSAKVARGQPIWVLLLLITVTAVLSSCLDNVTTVLLIAPVTLLVADQLGVNPGYFLLPEVLASNIGGTATLIGDPPNILIGSYARLDFLSFITNLTPIVVLVMAVFSGALYLRLRGTLTTGVEQRARIMDLDEKRAISDPVLLRKALIVLGITMIGFLFHGLLHLEPGVVAMAGAAVLLVVTGTNVEKALEEVEWTTLFFFLGLFILVSGAIEIRFIDKLAVGVRALAGDNTYVSGLVILWGAAICAGIMNNVSFTAAALPIVGHLNESLGFAGPMANAMWWALALGACLGGNLTPVGSAANVITLDMAARNGYKFSFGEFMKWSVPTTLMSLVLASFWVFFLIWQAM